MVYDADGTRIIRHDPGGYTTLTLPDGTELRANGAGAVAGTRYYNGAATRTANTDTSGNLTSGTTLTWTIPDHHGTGAIAVNPTTLQADHRRSLPYGQPRGTQPTGFGTKGFVGGTSDPTGLTHVGAREYDPSLGQFISLDPVFDNKDPQSWNGYAYSDSTPITNSDPSGTVMTEDRVAQVGGVRFGIGGGGGLALAGLGVVAYCLLFDCGGTPTSDRPVVDGADAHRTMVGLPGDRWVYSDGSIRDRSGRIRYDDQGTVRIPGLSAGEWNNTSDRDKIEEFFGGNLDKPGKRQYPYIDTWVEHEDGEGGTGISIKSIDWRKTSYRIDKPSIWGSPGKKALDDLDYFQRNGVPNGADFGGPTIQPGQIRDRILIMAYPKTSDPAVIQQFNRIVAEGAKRQITVYLFQVETDA
jgi:RHS repeat-associated protein